MNLREALILQHPSLALQRAAADKIAEQDVHIRNLYVLVGKMNALLRRCEGTIVTVDASADADGGAALKALVDEVNTTVRSVEELL